MSYRYEDERPKLFTEDGVVLFTRIRDHARKLLNVSGAFTMGAVISVPGVTAWDWTKIACVDRMVELGELREMGKANTGQGRTFVQGPNWVG